MNQNNYQKNCDKIILASSLGLCLTYCPDCQIVELEIGAISLRISPELVQRMANVMMKASLNLERVQEHERISQVVAERLSQARLNLAKAALPLLG